MKNVLCALAVVAIAGSALAKKAEKPTGITVTSKSPQAVAAFKKGRLLLTGSRRADAIVELKRAVALDPDFALANAMLGAIAPGPEGDALLDKGLAGAAKLPDAERLEIELLAAEHKGDVT